MRADDRTEKREQLASGLEKAARQFARSVLPIYLMDDRRLPIPWGTCLMLEVGGKPFLVSAAHVIEIGKQRPLYVGGLWVHQLTGVFHHTTPPSGRRELDRIDIAVCPLDQSDVEEIGATYVTPAQMDLVHMPDPNVPRPYLAMGYPSSKQPRVRDGAQDGYPMFVGTRLAPSNAVSIEKIDARKSLLFEFDVEDMETRAGIGRAPAPQGISGGGIWDLAAYYAGTGDPKLVAVTVEQAGPQRQCLLATRVSVVVDVILRSYPDLRLP